jgi:DNA gyrase inhibitor GyrI
MVVDILIKRVPAYDVIAKRKIGPYSGSNMLRSEFGQLVRWAKKNKVKTGKWFFIELDGPDVSSSKRRWEACIEVKGKLKSAPEGGIESKKLNSELVASVTFDPDQFSSRLVYHGLECWLDWRKKFGEYEEAGPTREVYLGNPWTEPKAWANLDVQVPVKKLK